MATDIRLRDQYYLTRAQFEELQDNEELIIGAQYYITDEDFSNVSVSATGTATDKVNYITIDGTEKKLGGTEVSVSDTGTSTDEINYITIDGEEKKIAGGGGNVDDVQLNSESIVNNKVANIPATEVNTIGLSTAISSSSTDTEVGTAKAVYDAIKSGSVAIGTTAPTDGNVWIDTTDSSSPSFKYKNGSTWTQVGGKLYSDASGTNTDGAVTQAGVKSALDEKVPTTRTINSKALSSNITLSASDVDAVPTTRTVNSKTLSGNITLSASDVGAAASSHTQAASTITAGTLAGQVLANASAVTTLTTGQLRNIYISTAEPTSSDGNNGDIWIKYSE